MTENAWETDLCRITKTVSKDRKILQIRVWMCVCKCGCVFVCECECVPPSVPYVHTKMNCIIMWECVVFVTVSIFTLYMDKMYCSKIYTRRYIILIWQMIYLCWRRLSCRLKYLPHTSHENVTSGLLCVRSWIIKLYDFVNRLWQYLQMKSHFGRILRRKSDRQSSSIRIIANILSVVLVSLE